VFVRSRTDIVDLNDSYTDGKMARVIFTSPTNSARINDKRRHFISGRWLRHGKCFASSEFGAQRSFDVIFEKRTEVPTVHQHRFDVGVVRTKWLFVRAYIERVSNTTGHEPAYRTANRNVSDFSNFVSKKTGKRTKRSSHAFVFFLRSRTPSEWKGSPS